MALWVGCPWRSVMFPWPLCVSSWYSIGCWLTDFLNATFCYSSSSVTNAISSSASMSGVSQHTGGFLSWGNSKGLQKLKEPAPLMRAADEAWWGLEYWQPSPYMQKVALGSVSNQGSQTGHGSSTGTVCVAICMAVCVAACAGGHAGRALSLI